MKTLALALAMILGSSTCWAVDRAAEVEQARRECRESRKWPSLPTVVPNCPVDWTDAESVEAQVVYPEKAESPAAPHPEIPANEEIRWNPLFLEVLIDAQGQVVDVCVLESVSPTVDQYFVERAKATTYKAGNICGVEVPFALNVVIHHHAYHWPRAR